jgi:2-polyprenyl-6-methoxyphenol hydroxylase-like FAD-dependent oxidoreductase
MANRQSHFYDVIIAGGGPVGLFLACELRLAGRSVLVLEKAADTRSPLKRPPFGMRGLSAASLEALYRRGVLDAVIAAQETADSASATRDAAHWMQQTRRPAGHFAGIQFYEDDIEPGETNRVPSSVGDRLMVTLESFEGVLAARAEAMGAAIRRGIGVEDFDQADDQVIVCAGSETFRCHWLVGCDGAHSVVRKAGGFAFIGTEPEFTGYSAEVELADPDGLAPGRHYTPTGMYSYARPGTFALADFDGGAFHRTLPITSEHLQAVLRRISGKDVTLTALRLATSWTDRAYQATAYRNGRVLLAGDAAHIHSPLGGQGLNLGLGDAMNIGWKLAGVIEGWAPAGLLDSYERERHPIGAQVLDWSRAQVAIMRPAPGSRALEAIMRDLIGTRDGATYFAGRVSGRSLRYDIGNDHPLVGCSVPDFELAGGTKAGELLRNGTGLLLDFGADRPLRRLADRWGGRITYAGGDAVKALGLSAVLVRPDGFVAWTSEGQPDERAAAEAISCWFGKSLASS